ncbi:MAG TPA: SHOCT domain-containing protein [Pelovirga sp.]|nr:SHOCT domain-containing protein [Pelovirga sp.]
MMGWFGQGGYGMGHGFGGFAMMLFWLVIIVAGIWFVKTLSTGKAQNDSPMDMLKKRYAKGEITKDEYDRMKRDIEE